MKVIMPRPGDSINEKIENKLDLTESLESFTICNGDSFIYGMSKKMVQTAEIDIIDSSMGLTGNEREYIDEEASEPVAFGRNRRMALADIFENVNENDIVRLFSMYVKQEIAQLVNRQRFGRRGAKSDIFEGMSENDIKDILKHSSCDQGIDDEEVSDTEISGEVFGALNKRRGGKCDIFEGLTLDQQRDIVTRFYTEYFGAKEECKTKIDTASSEHAKSMKAGRRGGKFNIFDGLTDEERLHIINMCIETYCNDSEQIQVGYGR